MAASGSELNWTHDRGRLQAQAYDLAGTAAAQSVTFGYNPASQITSEARTNDYGLQSAL